MQIIDIFKEVISHFPELHSVNYNEALLKFICSHRLESRLIYSEYSENFKNAYPNIFDELVVKIYDNKIEFQKTMNVLNKFMLDERLINTTTFIIKGYSLYIYCPDLDKIRRSSDVDIFTTNTDKLKDVILSYSSEQPGRTSPHELLNAKAFGIKFDLHSHYPIWSPIANTGKTNLDKKRNLVYHYGNISIGKLSVENLINENGHLIFSEHGALKCVDMAAAALIHCAHCYRNSVSRSSVSIRNVPPIRICELFEIRDYLINPHFDKARFFLLIEKLNAFSSVIFVARLLSQYLNDKSLERILSFENIIFNHGNEYPICVWGGFWQYIAWNSSYFFHRHITTSDLIKKYNENVLHLKKNKTASIFINEHFNNINPHTIHIFESLDRIINFSADIMYFSDEIKISLSIPIVTKEINKRVYIDLFEQSFEHNLNIISGEKKWKSSRREDIKDVSSQTYNDNYTLFVTFSLQSMQPPIHLPCIIAIGEFELDHIMHAGIMFPLTLTIS